MSETEREANLRAMLVVAMETLGERSQRIAELEAENAHLRTKPMLARIAKLEAELAKTHKEWVEDIEKWRSWWWSSHAGVANRPDDVLTIDGQRWRVTEVRAGDAPSLRDATLVPVKDTE